MNNKKYIVVTGAAGLIGSNVVAELNDRGFSDIIVVDNPGLDDRWKNLRNRTISDWISIEKFPELIANDDFAKSIQSIIHLGACSSTTEKDATFLLSNNYEYSKNLCLASIKNNIRFVYASSAATYGDGEKGYDDNPELLTSLKPLNKYGYSKYLFDMWALKNGYIDKIVGLKFFNVYGPNELHKDDMRSVVCKSYEQILSHGYVSLFKSYRKEYTDGGQKRDFIYVKDCADAMLWLLENPTVNGVFNLGTGNARSWKDLALAVYKSMNKKEDIQYIEMPEHLKGQYQYFTEASMQRLHSAGYDKPFTSLEDGVKDYVQQYLMKSGGIR